MNNRQEKLCQEILTCLNISARFIKDGELNQLPNLDKYQIWELYMGLELLKDLELAYPHNSVPHTYRITTHGTTVTELKGGLSEYLKEKARKETRAEKKAELDIFYLEFFKKTKLLPFIISIISIGLAIWALLKNS